MIKEKTAPFHGFEIIDFHTHPFREPYHNIASHKDFCGMSEENTRLCREIQRHFRFRGVGV